MRHVVERPTLSVGLIIGVLGSCPSISSPGTLSPSKRLFHSPPLSTSGGQLPSLPPRPSSTPVNNNNYSVMVTVTSTASSDDDDLLEEEDGGGQKMPIKPSPIRLHPNDPVWRPF